MYDKKPFSAQWAVLQDGEAHRAAAHLRVYLPVTWRSRPGYYWTCVRRRDANLDASEPAGGEASLSLRIDDDVPYTGFSIKCSQSYERMPTQTQGSFRFWDTDDQVRAAEPDVHSRAGAMGLQHPQGTRPCFHLSGRLSDCLHATLPLHEERRPRCGL